MQANIDQAFLDMLNARLGTHLTWKEFWEVYRARKAQRDADPILRARRERERRLTEWMWEHPESAD